MMRTINQASMRTPRPFMVKLLERDISAETESRQSKETETCEQLLCVKLTLPLTKTVMKNSDKCDNIAANRIVSGDSAVSIQYVPRPLQDTVLTHWGRVIEMFDVVLNSSLSFHLSLDNTLSRPECARLYYISEPHQNKMPAEVKRVAEQLFAMGLNVTSKQPNECQRRSRYAMYNPEDVMRSVRLLIDLNCAEPLFAAYSYALRNHISTFLHIVCCVQSYFNQFCKLADTCVVSRNIFVLYILTVFWRQFRSVLHEIASVCVFLNRWYICHYAGEKSLEQVGVNCLKEMLTSHHPYRTYSNNNNNNDNCSSSYREKQQQQQHHYRASSKQKKYKRQERKYVQQHQQYHINLNEDNNKNNNNNNSSNANIINEEEEEEYEYDDDNSLTNLPKNNFISREEFCKLMPLACSGFSDLVEFEIRDDAHTQELQQRLKLPEIANMSSIKQFVKVCLAKSVFGHLRPCNSNTANSNTNDVTANECDVNMNDIRDNTDNSNDNNVSNSGHSSDTEVFYTPRSQLSQTPIAVSLPTVTTTITTEEEKEEKKSVALLSQPQHTLSTEQFTQQEERETLHKAIEQEQSLEQEEEEQEWDKEVLYNFFREFLSLCTALDVYNNMLLPSLQHTLTEHYTTITNACAESLPQSISAANYFSYVHLTFIAWRTRTFAYLHHNSLPIIEELVQKSLLDDRAKALLKRDFASCMQSQNYKTLSLAWRLLSESTYICDRQCVLYLFKSYVEEEGKEIMSNIHNKNSVNNTIKNNDFNTVINKTLIENRTSEHAERIEINRVISQLLRDNSNNHNKNESLTFIHNNVCSNNGNNAKITNLTNKFVIVLTLLQLLQYMNDAIDNAFVNAKRDFVVKLNEALESVLEIHSESFAWQLACFTDVIMKVARTENVTSKLKAAATTTKHESLLSVSSNVNNKAANNATNSYTSTTNNNNTNNNNIVAASDAATDSSQSNLRKRARFDNNNDTSNENDSELENNNDTDKDKSEIENTHNIYRNTKYTDIIHELLTQISVLFAHLPNKSYFIGVYEYQLAQRLLSSLYYKTFSSFSSSSSSSWSKHLRCQQQEEEQQLEYELKQHDCSVKEGEEEILLLQTTFNAEQEMYFINLVRDICGTSFTSRLDGMCKDCTSPITSSSHQENVCKTNNISSNNNNNNNNSNKDISCAFYFLTSSFWPVALQPAKSTSSVSAVQQVSCSTDEDNNVTNNNVTETSINNLATTTTATTTNCHNINSNANDSNNESTNKVNVCEGLATLCSNTMTLPTEEWRSLLLQKELEYHAKYDKRRVQWQHELSTVTFTGEFTHSHNNNNNNINNSNSSNSDGHNNTANHEEWVQYTFHGSVLQGAILLILDQHRYCKTNSNTHAGVTFCEMCKELCVNITAPEIRSAVLSLNSPSCKLITILSSKETRSFLANSNDNNDNSNSRIKEKSSPFTNDDVPLDASSLLLLNEEFTSSTQEVYLPLSSTTKQLLMSMSRHSVLLGKSDQASLSLSSSTTSTPLINALPNETQTELTSNDPTIATTTTTTNNNNNNNINDSSSSSKSKDNQAAHTSKKNTEVLLHRQVIGAWVVTFMKRNQTSENSVLLDFVKSKVSTFTVSNELFKSAIDWCVERGYLQRVNTSPNENRDNNNKHTNKNNDNNSNNNCATDVNNINVNSYNNNQSADIVTYKYVP